MGSERDGHIGVLRIPFADEARSRLLEVNWNDRFAPIEERQLVFFSQERTKDGDQSTVLPARQLGAGGRPTT